MVRWCAYCQEFQGEVAPFDDFNITHGICASCKAKGFAHLETEIEHALMLRDTQDRLMDAGRAGDFDAAEEVVDYAIANSLRPVDIMVGLVAPLLYVAGEEWRHGTICVGDEHRFTSFCERVFELVKRRMRVEDGSDSDGKRTRVLMMNAYGNRHTLAIRVLALWLRSKDIDAEVLDPPPRPDELIGVIRSTRPTALLVSLAQAEQRAGVMSIVETIGSMGGGKPALFVGGNAVKMELVMPVPGSIFLTSFAELIEQIQSA